MTKARRDATALPSRTPFLTAEDLGDDDKEIIFVQHDPSLAPQVVANSVQALFGRRRRKEVCSLTEISLENAVYPVAFGPDSLQISRPVDRYFFASPM
jgi:hypothetical protein